MHCGLAISTQVAKNLANTYGDKAPEVAKLASLTGRRWPVLGQSVLYRASVEVEVLEGTLCVKYMYMYMPRTQNAVRVPPEAAHFSLKMTV